MDAVDAHRAMPHDVVAAARPTRAPQPGGAGAAAWGHPPPRWRERRNGHQTRAGAAVRRSAAPLLHAGLAPAAVADRLGITSAQLAAVHATVFDPTESPLKTRRLLAASHLLRRVLALPGLLHGQVPRAGWRVERTCGPAAAGDAAPLAPDPGLQLFAWQQGAAAAELRWFDRAGHALWTWQPAPGAGSRLDDLVRGWGDRTLRIPGPLSRPGATATEAGCGVAALGAAAPLLPGAAWDLVLHAAARGLPLRLACGMPAVLVHDGPLQRVCLDGAALRLDAGGLALWLDDAAPWTWSGPDDRALQLPGLRLDLAPQASRADTCAWRHLAEAVRIDQPVPPCCC